MKNTKKFEQDMYYFQKRFNTVLQALIQQTGLKEKINLCQTTLYSHDLTINTRVYCGGSYNIARLCYVNHKFIVTSMPIYEGIPLVAIFNRNSQFNNQRRTICNKTNAYLNYTNIILADYNLQLEYEHVRDFNVVLEPLHN